MTAKPYVPVTWGDEPVFTDKLNQMGNNEQWLFENTPRMYYNAFDVKKPNGVKIMAGILVFPPSATAGAQGYYYFGSFFSSGSKPVVVATVNTLDGQRGGVVSIRGIGVASPDHRGFSSSINNSTVTKITSQTFIHFIAVGW